MPNTFRVPETPAFQSELELKLRREVAERRPRRPRKGVRGAAFRWLRLLDWSVRRTAVVALSAVVLIVVLGQPPSAPSSRAEARQPAVYEQVANAPGDVYRTRGQDVAVVQIATPDPGLSGRVIEVRHSGGQTLLGPVVVVVGTEITNDGKSVS